MAFDEKVLDRLRRLVQSEFTKRREVLRSDVACLKEEMVGHNSLVSGATLTRMQGLFDQEVQIRARIIWEMLQRVHKVMGAFVTETLSDDMKCEVRSWIRTIGDELEDGMQKELGFMPREAKQLNLNGAIGDVEDELSIEIDLYVDSLEQKTSEKETKEAGQEKKISDGNVIFISHAAEDRCIAEEVKRQIEDVFGDKVSVFVSSVTIEPGDDWLEKIVESLMHIDALLVIFTPLSEGRPFVWFEIGFAWLQRLKGYCEIYPLCVPPIDPGSLPEPVCRLQGISLAEENKVKSFFEKLAFQFGAGDLKELDQGAMTKCFPEYPKEVLKEAETDMAARTKRMQELIAEKRVPACNKALQIVSSLRGLLIQDTIEGSLAFMREHGEWFEKNTAFLPYEFSDRWVSMKLNLRKAEMMSNAQENMQDGTKRIGMIGEIVNIQTFTDELAKEAENVIRGELSLPPRTIYRPKEVKQEEL